MKIPYPLTPAVSLDRRHDYMLSAIVRGLPRLQQVPINDAQTLSLACYGPSLRDTWSQLRPPIMSMSGATKWLAARGVIADYHVDMDPRENKILDVDPPVPGVHYLMASVCCPAVFDRLQGERVTLWHTYSGTIGPGYDTYGWVYHHDRPNELVVHGGSTIGLTALHVGGVLGYRHFEVHGMDGSFSDDTRSCRHAGPHNADHIKKLGQQDGITWAANGTVYQTSKIMANAVAETVRMMRNFPMFCVFHGEGLTQALIKEAQIQNACCADETVRAQTIRTACAHILPIPPAQAGFGGVRSFWDAFLARAEAGRWLDDALRVQASAESRRMRASYNTGTVPLETALLLRGLVAYYQPSTVAEIGTFIGTSAHALASCGATVYTCDERNDCLDATDHIITHPLTSSTAMLQRLVADGRTIDLWFIDGRIQPADVPMMERMSHPGTVYAFDDVKGDEKGTVNIRLMGSRLPRHVYVPPQASFEGRSTLGALIPAR